MPHRRRLERPGSSDKMPWPTEHTHHHPGPATNTANSPAAQNHQEENETWPANELQEAPVTPPRRRQLFSPPGPPPDRELPAIPMVPIPPLNVPTGGMVNPQREKRAGRLWDMNQPAIQDANAGKEELERLLEEVAQLQWSNQGEAADAASPGVKSESERKKKKKVRFAEEGEDTELQGAEEGEEPEFKDED